MKRIFCVFLLINFLFANSTFASVVVDELVNSLDKKLKIEYVETEKIEDEFALNYINQNLKIKKNKNTYFKDELVENLPKDLKIQKQKQNAITDNLVNYINKTTVSAVVKNEIDFNLEQGKIKVSPIKRYTTRTGLYEGESIDFVLVQDVKIKDKLYKKGELIRARVETVSKNMAYGVPADLVISNFVLPDKILLSGQIERQGANRALWVYPTGYILMPFFLLGAFIFPIRGGHAKLYPSKTYEVEI